MRHAAANISNNLGNKNDENKYQYAIKAINNVRDSFSRLSITPTLTQNQSYDP